MSDPLVLTRDEGTARIITLNRVEKRNAIDFELGEAFARAIDEVAENKDIRTVIVNGAGKGFCAGVDFFALGSVDLSGNAQFRHVVKTLQAIPNKIARLEKPVIAVMHGFCIGLGLEMVLACDVRIAEAGCRINIEEVRLGMIPDVGGSTRLVRTVGVPRAKELIMTGRTIDASVAETWGLVNQVVEEGEGLKAALGWHEDFAKGSPSAVGLAKIVLDRAYDLDDNSSMILEGMAQSTLIASEDFKEGLAARIEKRKPNWKGK